MARSKFQRRHYEAIAECLHEELMDVSQESSGTLEQRLSYKAELSAIRSRLASMFKQDNASFDEFRFIKAAGGYSKEAA